MVRFASVVASTACASVVMDSDPWALSDSEENGMPPLIQADGDVHAGAADVWAISCSESDAGQPAAGAGPPAAGAGGKAKAKAKGRGKGRAAGTGVVGPTSCAGRGRGRGWRKGMSGSHDHRKLGIVPA